MKKSILILSFLLTLVVNAQSLKGGVTESYIPKGFFGTWGVISKLNYSNNPKIFNYESRDIWTLSGYSNILILENLQSGAHSEIELKDKSVDGKTLKFSREKTVENNENKTIYRELVTFTLQNDRFSGFDEYIVEKYSNKKQVSKDIGKYIISGVKISGSTKID